VDAAKQQLISNRQLLQQLSAKSGLQLPEGDAAFASFTQAVAEWDNQASTHGIGALQGGTRPARCASLLDRLTLTAGARVARRRHGQLPVWC
jgi:hypothetical protein